jgi:hypothetical protein
MIVAKGVVVMHRGRSGAWAYGAQARQAYFEVAER